MLECCRWAVASFVICASLTGCGNDAAQQASSDADGPRSTGDDPKAAVARVFDIIASHENCDSLSDEMFAPNPDLEERVTSYIDLCESNQEVELVSVGVPTNAAEELAEAKDESSELDEVTTMVRVPVVLSIDFEQSATEYYLVERNEEWAVRP